MNLFKSLMYLGGLDDIDPRIYEDESFGATYGNRIASEHAFGPSSDQRPPERRQTRRPAIAEQLAAGGCG